MKFLIPLIFIVAVSGCIGQAEDVQPLDDEPRVVQAEFITDDGWRLKADYHSNQGKPSLILLHMLGRDSTSWDGFTEQLSGDYSVLALDIRGHGRSNNHRGTERSWEDFSEQDWNAAHLDISAAKHYLEDQGQDVSRVSIIGASIGANLALRYAAFIDQSVDVALLSPGLDYRSITTKDAMQRFERKVLMAAAEDDPQAAAAVRQLETIGTAEKEVIIYPAGGHGTNLLGTTDLDERIVAWLQAL